MNKSKSNLTIEDNENEFIYQKKKTGLNIKFNRVAFIFFIFFTIYTIYSIHLIKLGTLYSKVEKTKMGSGILQTVGPEFETMAMYLNDPFFFVLLSNAIQIVSPFASSTFQ